MAAPTTLDLLRLDIDDPVPEDHTLSPQFTDDELNAALVTSYGDPQRAAATVWTWKAAAAAAMVDVTEGNASRAMSDLQAHALAMVKKFDNSRQGPTEGRTTMGRITRRRY